MEFHAVILCGSGKALSPFSQVRSTGMPKALLPIANRPMIDYVLEWCEKAFFPKVTVVCDTDSSEQVQKALDQYNSEKSKKEKAKEDADGDDDDSSFSRSVEILGLDSSSSGEVLYHLYKTSALKTNPHFVILPCDFITNLPPQVLIEAYRNRNESDLGLMVYYRNQLDIEDKKSKIFPKNYTIYSDLPDGQCQLLDIYSKEDIDFHKTLQIRTQMCWKFPNSTISTKLLNGSVFFGSVDRIFAVFDQEDKCTESYFHDRSITKVIRDLSRRSWKHSDPKDTVGFCILPDQATFFRVNNTPVLMEANRHFMKLQAMAKGQHQQQTSHPKDKASANIGIDCSIGENTSVGEKTNVKRTIVGSSCSIGKRVKLTGCLILNNITIEDDVQLENCILGNGVIIRSKSRLTNCNVESSLEVAKGTHSKGDTLLCLSLEGIVEDDEEEFAVDSGESDSDDESGSDYSYDDYDEYDDNSDGLFAH
ncbi:DEHA2F14718p [Debaryomyces hansenii CBS767]|uniref:Translation initiation factor eIF2B subunit gamma n=1 Tax=Debaryomyces hansenii (strain ATCC 36239 / CBS 767 / BCRC 21394 / JCM 1990 / NBRC 0083 / IGC 2968) TaxID=284592 RepID=Q6BLC0_DEBHA|nr:DEHA2F14718p [Debaryomyces hansenii CBS767]CAG89369.2 DEHA2F14718p [Debaryomyces hansenii CBS767]|eukprot:XP_461001.2 DEHA2F14718p [Debaryomyces hansenii CBS767]